MLTIYIRSFTHMDFDLGDIIKELREEKKKRIFVSNRMGVGTEK